MNIGFYMMFDFACRVANIGSYIDCFLLLLLTPIFIWPLLLKRNWTCLKISSVVFMHCCLLIVLFCHLMVFCTNIGSLFGWLIFPQSLFHYPPPNKKKKEQYILFLTKDIKDILWDFSKLWTRFGIYFLKPKDQNLNQNFQSLPLRATQSRGLLLKCLIYMWIGKEVMGSERL